jgi:hypothetical protein
MIPDRMIVPAATGTDDEERSDEDDGRITEATKRLTERQHAGSPQ